MKKYFALWLAACFFAPCLSGGAYRPGDVAASAALRISPLELGTDWGEVNVHNHTTDVAHDAKLGKPGFGGEVQALYFISSRLAAGVAAGSDFFTRDLASGLYMDVSTHVTALQAIGRFYLNPAQTYRAYLAFGAGAARTHMTVYMQTKEHFRYTGFSGHVGAGVERAVSDHWTLGAEMRYNVNRFHRTKLSAAGECVSIYPQANYISLLLRAGYKL